MKLKPTHTLRRVELGRKEPRAYESGIGLSGEMR